MQMGSKLLTTFVKYAIGIPFAFYELIFKVSILN